jgi:hypothetical protein
MIRARHTFGYLILLAAVAGYFYYFEVVKPQQKSASERIAKKAFHFAVDQVTGLEILVQGGKPLRLAKDGRWRMVEPIASDVDEAELNGLVGTLEGLENERQVVASGDDLSPFGLQQPALTVRFKVGDAWHELLLGDKNPVGDAYYAKTGERTAVFLIAQGNWTVFNKGVNDLRRRQLFTFEPRSVIGLQLDWQDGSQVGVTRENDNSWKCQQHPETVIKKSKVDNVLDQLQWLRARDFLADDVAAAAGYGLEPPDVIVKLQLKDNREVTLLLGKEDQSTHRVAALSSELPAIVQVEGSILQELPKDLRTLENRSLLEFKTDQVKQVIWKLAATQGHAIHSGDSKWSLQDAAGKAKELKQSWRIRSLLWELDETTYEQRMRDNPQPPEKPQGTLEFWDSKEKLGALVWGAPVATDAPMVTVWKSTGAGHELQAVQVKAEVIRKLEEKAQDLTNESEK